MKILFITPYYKPAWFYGGPPKCISEQAESLQQHKNIHVEVVTLNLNGQSELYPLQATPVVVEINGVTVHYLPVVKNLLGKKYFIGRNMASYLQRFKNFNIIHVHTLFNFVSKTGMRFADRYNIPYVVTPHGMLDEVALSRSSFMKKIHRFMYEDRLLRTAKFIQFTTDGELKDAVLKETTNTGVIPLGVKFSESIQAFEQRAGRDGTKVLKLVFLGRVNKIKGISLLLTALSLVEGNLREKIFLDVFGDDDDNYLAELLALKAKLQLTNVEFKGKLEPSSRDSTLRNYDTLVLTSFLESFGLVVVEALNLGLPVLITDRVKLASFVINKECGWVSEQDADAIASTIETAFHTSAKKRKEMGARGAIEVRENFSIDKVTDDMINLYKS